MSAGVSSMLPCRADAQNITYCGGSQLSGVPTAQRSMLEECAGGSVDRERQQRQAKRPVGDERRICRPAVEPRVGVAVVEIVRALREDVC